MHAVRVHGHCSGVSAKVPTPWCPCCLMYFHTPRRAAHHAAYSSHKCKVAILASLPDVPVPPYQDFLSRRAEGRESRQGKPDDSKPELSPALPAAGPLPSWAPARSTGRAARTRVPAPSASC
eukprot:13800108-Alexandrium_andersonii.AAC.1